MKKLIILILTLLLIISVAIGNEYEYDTIQEFDLASSAAPAASSDTTVPPVTVKPKPDASSAAATASSAAATSESSSGEKLVDCYPAKRANFADGDSSYTPITTTTNGYCAMTTTNAQIGTLGSNSGLIMTIDECKGCIGKKYSCSEVQLDSEVSYGNYSWFMQAAKGKGFITKMNLLVGSGSTAYEIYFLLHGDGAKIVIGFTHPNEQGQGSTNAITLTSIGIDYTAYALNYTIYWDDQEIKWYIGGSLKFSTGYNNLPSPLQMLSSVYIDKIDTLAPPVFPASALLLSFAYYPECNITVNDERWKWRAGSPLWYYTTKCVNLRPEFIYNDTFLGNWNASSAASLLNVAYTAQKKRGTNAFLFNLESGQNSGVQISTKKPFPKGKFKYLTFWMNGESYSASQQVTVYVISNRTLVGSVNVGDFIKGARKPSEWYKVIIPMKKFIINPPETKNLDGFFFKNTLNTFSGSLIIDDMQLNYGPLCYENKTNVIYKDGSTADGVKNYARDVTNFRSNQLKFRSKPTIEWHLDINYNIKLGFEAGSIDANDYNALLINFYYDPDVNFRLNDNDPSQTPNQPTSQLVITTDNGATQLPPLSLVPYLGGELPPSTWIELVIPWEDLGLWDGAPGISGIQFNTNQYSQGVSEGTIYVGRLMAVTYVPPPSEDSPASKLFVQNLPLFILLTLVLLFITF